MHFSSNIRFLRKRKQLTQLNLAQLLGITRSSLNGYENDIARPSLETLIEFSHFFKISIDNLLKIDLSKLSELNLQQLESGGDPYVRGTQLRVLTTTVNSENKENVEMVNEKAKAGYATGFADPEYISELPRYSLPLLSGNKKYRSFQITGDSMLPIPEGAWITAEFIQDWSSLKPGELVIVLTLQEGIVFKKISSLKAEESLLILESLNPAYPALEIHWSDIREIWKFTHFLSSKIPESILPEDSLNEAVFVMKKDIDWIKKQLKQSGR
mgnify:CR=1 FL=1